MTSDGFVVEAHCLQGPRRHRGIGRYVSCLLDALHEAGALRAVLFNPVLGPPPTADLSVPATLWRPNTRRERRRTMGDGRGGYLVTSPFEIGASAGAALPLDVEDLGTVGAIVYDLIPFLFPDHYLEDPSQLARHRGHAAILQRASLLLAISEATRADAIRVLERDPDDVVNIGAGLPDGFAPARADEQIAWEVHRANRNVAKPFVLCVGAYEWRKNIPGLIDAWSRLPADIRRRNQLVVACDLPDYGRREWTEIAQDHGVEQSVVFTGHTEDATLQLLYRAARLFVFPSRYEGFGFPPLEAMASGTPTIVAGNSSLLELSEENARFDVDDVAAMAELMERGLTDESYRASLLERGREMVERHTWTDTAERAVAAFREHTRPPRPSVALVRPFRARIALIGPFSPARTGVGVYNTRLAERLIKRADLDCFVDDGWRIAEAGGADRYPVEILGAVRQPHDYDAALFVLGNSRYHNATYDHLVNDRGIAWFHDVNLTGLHRVRADEDRSGRPLDAMASAFDRCYGSRARRPGDLLDHDAIARDGFFMSVEATRAATRTIVSSSVAARYLEIDAGSWLREPSIVLPLAFPDATAAPIGRTGGGRPTVVSFGNLHEIKRPDVILDAMAMIPAKRRPLLVFAGPDEQRNRRAFALQVDRLGLHEDVVVTGWLSTAEYLRWLAEADVVVQLRRISYGESSATVSEAMACGRAVVTSVAACADLPDGVHVQVPEDIDSAALSAVVSSLVEDPRRRREIGAAAIDHAASWTFDHLAARLVELASVQV